MAYDPTTKIINAPVSIYDVQRAIGDSSTDLGTLCQQQKINRWSKMKPVAFPYIEPTRSAPVAAYGKQLWWWKGHPSVEEVAAGLVVGNYTCGNKCAWITCCGIKMLGFSTKIDALRAMNPVGNPYHTGDNSPLAGNFAYVPPTGGAAEPFRLVDFNYYLGGANYNIIPDYGTESGTSLVNANNPQSRKVTCGIMCQAVSDTINSELSFNDLFGEAGTSATFTVLTGVLSGNNINLVNLSVSATRSDDYFKEVSVYLDDSQVYGKTVVVLYVAAVVINGTTYYVPLMQSTGDHPNTPITYAPLRKIVNSWHVENSIPYYAITFKQKQLYGSSYPWTDVSSMSYFDTSGLMNRWYLKISMPRKSSPYTVANNAFKVEFTGQFRDSRGQMQLVYYTLTSDITDFVLRANEVTDSYNWRPTETVTIAAGSGAQEVYLAIYNLFANRSGVDVIYGGTVWRVRLWYLNGQSTFSPEPDVEYGSIDNNHLNINVPAVS